MKKELIIKKCNKCGAIIKEIKKGNCENNKIICCEEEMKTQVANSVDAAVEKHVPMYEIKENKIYVKVNHVMEEEHYIEWISLVSDKEEITINLQPNEEAEVVFPMIENATLYAYCNKHGLWKKEM